LKFVVPVSIGVGKTFANAVFPVVVTRLHFSTPSGVCQSVELTGIFVFGSYCFFEQITASFLLGVVYADP